ncbi:MAG: LolA family protein [Flavobacteriaceae bacterium]
MKLKHIITGLALTLSLTAFTQSQAKSLLNEVSAKVKTYNSISISFKYVLENTAENIKQETKGDVVLQGEKYKLNILGVTRLFDGKTLYNISPEDEEVTVSNENTNEDDTITPSKMLTFYQDGYTYKMDIEQNINGRKIQYVKLTPIDTHSEIDYILLGIDKQTKHIYNLIQVGENKTKTILTVTELKTNEPLPKSFFSFDTNKYKDYYINNLD